MGELKRTFIFGAGFSKAAGMPLCTELLPLILERLPEDEERNDWLEGMRERLNWLYSNNCSSKSFQMNIEQVFHMAHFDAEVHRLRQQSCPVERGAGMTPWNDAESVDCWVTAMGNTLADVILDQNNKADLSPVIRLAENLTCIDSILTFNYDTLIEQSLIDIEKGFNHGIEKDNTRGVSVYKLHGSIDWLVAHRNDSYSKLEMIFDKKNRKRRDRNTGYVEEDYRLWRCRDREQLEKWISGRDLQWVREDGDSRTVGMAGLGAYKPLHEIPGLGLVWQKGMQQLFKSDMAVVVGFSLSDFDMMAQMQFAEVARNRENNNPLKVVVIDPYISEEGKQRFERVFREVKFIQEKHENFDWSKLDTGQVPNML